MDLQMMTYLIVGATFALYMGIAVVTRAKSTADFYVADKGVNPIMNGMAVGADWMSAASFISMAGLIAFKGYDASVFLMGWTGGYVLLAMLLAPYLRKFGKFTVPEFIGDRYYSKTARLVAVLCLIIASLTYVIGQMKGIGVSFSRFLNLPFEIGLLVGMGIVFFYAVLGGMKGITYTQIAQYIVLIFAYTVPAVFISMQLTGTAVPQLGLGGTLSDGVTLLDKLDMTLKDLGFQAYTAQKGGTLNIVLYTLSLMIGTAGLPHVIMRFFTVPRVKDARTSAGWALFFIALLYTVAPAVGAMAFYNLAKTVQPGPVASATGSLEYTQRPQWFKNWETTGLLAWRDKNGDGRIQYAPGKPFVGKPKIEADKKGSFGEPVLTNKATNNKNELFVDRDIMVLANPEIAKLPNWVIALVAAGGIAAALSTAAGLLLAISSSISHDLMKGMFTPDISEKNELMAGRIAMGGAILVAGYFGLHPPGFAAQVVALAFGLAASSLFPAIMMGIFSKRINSSGAIMGMISGISVTMLYIFWYKGFFFIPGTNILPNNPSNWFFGISPEAFGSIGALVNFLVAYFVSKATDEPPQEIQDMVENIRIPSGAGAAVSH